MHELYELKDKLCEELKEYGNKDMSAGSLEVVDKLAHTIKNLDKIIENYEDEDYSNAMMNDGSYARNGRNGYSRRNSYARGRGRNARRDSMGRYSRERGYSMDGMEMAEQLRELAEDAPDGQTRSDIERLIKKIEAR